MNDQHNPYNAPQQPQHPAHMPPPGSGQYGSYGAYPHPHAYEQPQNAKHAELGIASFGLSLLAGLALFVMFVIAGVLESQSPDGLDEESTAAIVLGLLLILGVCVEFVALGLGIGSLFQASRKKLLGILGIVFSLLALFVFTVVMIAGVMLG